MLLDPTADTAYDWHPGDRASAGGRADRVVETFARLEAERRATALDDAIRRTGLVSAGTLARAARMSNA
jgi:hypothetical protein